MPTATPFNLYQPTIDGTLTINDNGSGNYGSLTATSVTATNSTFTNVNGSPVTTLDNPAAVQGYQAWTYDPSQSLAAGISINATTFAALIYVPFTFTTTKVDWYQVSGTPNVTCGLWPATAPAGVAVPLAFTTAAAATAAAVNTQSWNAGVTLTAGTNYMLTIFGSTTGVAGCLTATAAGANAGYVGSTAYSITTTYRCATVGTLAGTLSGSSTFGTSTLSADLVWFGLR